MRFRIGGVPFGVGAPLLSGLAGDPEIELTRAVPTKLIELLRGGELDAALVSSIEAFRTPGYRVVPGLAIASDGPAQSVRAFVKRGIKPRTVGCDEGSETSVALLRILLARVLHCENCTFTRVAPTLHPDTLAEDLVLLIGDVGMRAEPGTREVLDLGALWREWTGLPFVFALWLIAPGADARAITAKLARAKPEPRPGAVYHELGERELAGLMRFRREAAAQNLLDPRILPTFLTDAEDHE